MSKEAAAKTSTGSDPFADCVGGEAPKGFEEVGNPDLDGWFAPKEGRVFYGKICGHFVIEAKGSQREREIVLVRLMKPAVATVKEGKEDKEVRLEAGQVLAVGVSFKLRDMLSYVEHKGEVWAQVKGKDSIGNGQTMWKYDLRCRGTKAAPPKASVAGDDVPPF